MTAAKLRNYLVRHKLRRIILAQPNTVHLLTDHHEVAVDSVGVTVDGVFCPFGQWVVVDKAGNVTTTENLLNK